MCWNVPCISLWPTSCVWREVSVTCNPPLTPGLAYPRHCRHQGCLHSRWGAGVRWGAGGGWEQAGSGTGSRWGLGAGGEQVQGLGADEGWGSRLGWGAGVGGSGRGAGSRCRDKGAGGGGEQVQRQGSRWGAGSGWGAGVGEQVRGRGAGSGTREKVGGWEQVGAGSRWGAGSRCGGGEQVEVGHLQGRLQAAGCRPECEERSFCGVLDGGEVPGGGPGCPGPGGQGRKDCVLLQGVLLESQAEVERR